MDLPRARKLTRRGWALATLLSEFWGPSQRRDQRPRGCPVHPLTESSTQGASKDCFSHRRPHGHCCPRNRTKRASRLQRPRGSAFCIREKDAQRKNKTDPVLGCLPAPHLPSRLRVAGACCWAAEEAWALNLSSHSLPTHCPSMAWEARRPKPPLPCY